MFNKFELSQETFTEVLQLLIQIIIFRKFFKLFCTNTTNDKPDSGFKNNIITTGIGTRFEQYKNIYFTKLIFHMMI